MCRERIHISLIHVIATLMPSLPTCKAAARSLDWLSCFFEKINKILWQMQLSESVKLKFWSNQKFSCGILKVLTELRTYVILVAARDGDSWGAATPNKDLWRLTASRFALPVGLVWLVAVLLLRTTNETSVHCYAALTCYFLTTPNISLTAI